MTRRIWTIVPLAIVATLVIAVPAGAVPGLDLSVHEWPDEVGRGIVDPTGARQLLTIEVRPGRTASPEFRIRNTGNTTASVTVRGDAGSPRLAVAYIDDRGDDVTDAVVSGTFEVDVPGGRSRSVSALVTPREDSDTGPVGRVWVDVVNEHGNADRAGVRVVVPPIRVWATNYRGTIRCEATFPHRYVRPGDLIRASVSATNLSDTPTSVTPLAFLQIRGPDGELLDDTNDDWRYLPFHDPVRPGETVALSTVDTRVRWPGELLVRADCAGLRLPAARLLVVPPEGDVGTSDAIERAAGVPGSPFGACTPGPNGEPATGVLATPDGRELPPMTVRCWAAVRDEDGFANVDLFMVSPDDLPAYELGESPFESEPPIPDDGPNMLAARWSFVVTPHRVRAWRATMHARALGEGRAYMYELHDGEWRSGGYGGCGFYSYYLGSLGEVFILDWYTGCERGGDTTEARRLLTVSAPDGDLRTRRLP